MVQLPPGGENDKTTVGLQENKVGKGVPPDTNAGI